MNHNDKGRRGFLLGAAATAALHCATPAASNPQQVRTFHLVPQDLSSALRTVGREAGREIMFPSEAVAGKEAPALDGTMTADQAVAKLLEGSGLSVDYREDIILIRGRADLAADEAKERPTADIVVTGSRIRGAPVASPVVTLSQETIRESGKATLGDAVRTLPQNFGGGQNPGIAGNGAQANNTNFNSSSTINLRGLGPDATLTLFNGHRVAYDTNVQGIDVDAIPLAALDRIEIVPDGASALYGSDAVGGVANIILKRDYEGITASARYGGTTDGGGGQQEYSLVSGRKWDGGGFLAAVDYAHSSAIDASDRSYTSQLSPDQTLYPAIHHMDGILTGHQSIGRATLDFDAFYSRRTTSLFNTFIPPGPYDQDGFAIRPIQNSFEISPKLSIPFGQSWRAYLTGTYAADRSDARVRYFAAGTDYLDQNVRFNNSLRSTEAGFDGPLFRLFTQDVRLAVGAGYRSNGLAVTVISNGVTEESTRSQQSTYYGFGEISAPIITPSSRTGGIDSLSLSAAVRYEDYPHMDRIATPKFGIIYKPVSDITIKGSWGKSFKAPTLYQQFSPPSGTAFPASVFGASPFPATATAILLTGGNADLKPERATSWTATIEATPSGIPGLSLQASYFHTRYTHRVVDPIRSFAGIFDAADYQYLIHYGPSQAYLASLAATIPGGIVDGTGGTYQPSTVAAVIDDRQQNAAKQIISGVDAQLAYRLALRPQRSLTITGSASYLRSRQQLGPGQALAPLSGQIFFMPKWNARGGITYEEARFSLAANMTYIGSTVDARFLPLVRVGSMTPVDLTAIYHIRGAKAVLNHIDITLTVQNLFNEEPSRIRTTAPNDIPYDSSNYSSMGRFIGATVSKSF